MTDDFDIELRRRLEVLAAAAPVDGTGGLARVAPGVRPRRAATLVPSGLLVALVLLAVIGAALSGGVGQAPTATPATSESSPPNNGPVMTTDTDGAFELTVRSAHGHVPDGEPIDVEASLTYQGPDPTVEICHDRGGPIMFGIREKVFGAIDLTPANQLVFAHSTLTRDIPLVKPFAKSGSFPGDDPAAASFRAFFADPVLRLPPGTWHIYAVAASCSSGPLHFNLNAGVEIIVDA
jgi:hypothetical protein